MNARNHCYLLGLYVHLLLNHLCPKKNLMLFLEIKCLIIDFFYF